MQVYFTNRPSNLFFFASIGSASVTDCFGANKIVTESVSCSSCHVLIFMLIFHRKYICIVMLIATGLLLPLLLSLSCPFSLRVERRCVKWAHNSRNYSVCLDSTRLVQTETQETYLCTKRLNYSSNLKSNVLWKCNEAKRVIRVNMHPIHLFYINTFHSPNRYCKST